MKTIRAHLEKLTAVKRRKHHPLVHKIHKKYGISRKTLFYVKEYGPHANVSKTIIKESIKILLLGSIISSLGGLTFEYIKTVFISIIPLVILWPVLNDMIGDYGMIISSRFSTMLHEGKANKKWWKTKELRTLFIQILIVSLSTAVISSTIALAISSFSDYTLNTTIAYKIFLISVIDTVILVSALFLIAIHEGLHYYREKEDPNNFLIPITTSIADFGNMVLLSILVLLFF